MRRNILKHITSAATIMVLLVGCQSELLPEEDVNFGDGQIRYSISSVGVKSSADDVSSTGSLSLVSGDGKLTVPVSCEVSEGIDLGSGSAETKGALINTSGSDSALPADLGFTVSAYKNGSLLFSGEASKRSETDAYWTMDPPQYWPLSTKLTFYAYTNAGTNPVVQTATSQTLTYTVTGNAASHKDLMLGYYKGNGGNKGIAEMRFDHPLTAVRFKKGEMTGVTGIKSITLSGLASGGSVTMDADGVIGNWTVAGTENFVNEVTLSEGDNLLAVDESSKFIGKDSEGKYNGAFLVIPQTLSDHKVTVTAVLATESGEVTVCADITSGTWQAGKTNTFTLGYNEENPDLLPGVFSVSPTEYVQFSRGNLLATRSSSSSNDWKLGFFVNQYDYGKATSFTANDTEMSLFTFGFDTKATSFDPIGQTSGSEDWGNEYNRQYSLPSGTWQTLTGGPDGEWWYLLDGRPNAANLKAIKTVHGISNCLIIFPDDFDLSDIPSSTELTDDQWSDLEAKGAVCLPQAGLRFTSAYLTSSSGYWANNSYGAYLAYGAFFTSPPTVVSYSGGVRNYGYSVRLVQRFDKPEVEPDFIDLGFPSGTLWADVNVGATSKTGEGSYGKLYAWGETETKASFTIDNYRFTSSFTKYNATDLLTVLQSADDVAASKVSGSHIPTREQYEELINSAYTTYSWEDDYNGVPGLLITSKTYPTRSIFLPAAGLQMGGTQALKGTNGCYWSSTLNPTPASETETAFPACAIDLDFEKNITTNPPFVYKADDDSKRICGQSVRAVKQGQKTIEYVEIGGLKWATCNLGANTPKDYGWYFSWGGTTGYVHDGSKWVTAQGGSELSGGFSYANAPYNTGGVNTSWNKYIPTGKTGYWSGGGSPDNNLSLELVDDAARANWGGSWRMPTQADFQTLYEACGGTNPSSGIKPTPLSSSDPGKGIYWVSNTQTYISDYDGVAGILFCDGASKLFFVAAGYGTSTSFCGDGTEGRYWSGTVYSTNPSYAYRLGFQFGNVCPANVNERYQGFPVRPVSN